MTVNKRQQNTSGIQRRLDLVRNLVAQNYGTCLGLMIIAALAVRVVMLVDFVRSNPVAYSPDADAGVYWEMAGAIAHGRWIADQPFHSVPLYPYMLAVVRTLGGGLLSVYVLQLMVHVVTAVLLARLANRKFGRSAGLLAALFFLLLQEPAFLATRLVPSTLQLMLVTCVLLAADSFSKRGRLTDAIRVGAAVGLLSLVYPPAMILLPLLLPWMLVRARTGNREHADSGRESRQRGWVNGLAGAAAGALVILPATLHNWAACGEFIPITAHAGITFRQGNAPGSEGTYTAIEGVSPSRRRMHDDTARAYVSQVGRSGSYREIDAFFRKQAFDYLSSDVGRGVRLVGRKVWWFITGRHYGDIYFPALEQDSGWVHLLWLAPLPTPWLMGAACAGLILGWRRRWFNLIDVAMLLLPCLIVAVFWYSPRYRLPTVPALVVAATAGIAVLVEGLKRDRRQGRIVGTVAVLLVVAMATGPFNRVAGFDRPEEYRSEFECNRGQVYAQLGQFEQAVECFVESDRLRPDQPNVLAVMTEAYTQLGQLAQAEQAWKRLVKAAPNSMETWLTRGSLYLRRGQWEEAEAAFETCLAINPQEAGAHWGMWLALSSQGDRSNGMRFLRDAAMLDPGNAAASGEYAIVVAEAGQIPQAIGLLRQALQYSPDHPGLHFNLGLMLLREGLSREAAECFREALRLDPSHEKARQQLGKL